MQIILMGITIMIAAVGLGVPISQKLELSPLNCGLLCGGLNALFFLIFK